MAIIKLSENWNFPSCVSTDMGDFAFDADLELDFQDCKFLFPSGIIPLLCYSKQVINKGYKITTTNESADINQYLTRMGFYEQLSLPFRTVNKNTSELRFVEIYHFSKDTDDTTLQKKGLEVVDCITKEIPLDSRENITKVLELSISEIIDNARVHSFAQDCFLMVQNYPIKEFVEFTVADNGIGMQASMGANSVEEALINSLNPAEKGVNSPGAGNGLFITSQLVKSGGSIKSKFVQYSDNHYLEVGNNTAFLKSSNLSYPGTVSVLRIGYDASTNFSQFTRIIGCEPTFISYD